VVEWRPYDPPRLWTTPGRRGEPEYDLELFEPEFGENEPADRARHGLGIGVYQFGAFRFLVEVWTKNEQERASLEPRASAQVSRMIETREWIRRPDSRHSFWLYRGGAASRRKAKRKPKTQRQEG
jgi:hypothetical protein